MTNGLYSIHVALGDGRSGKGSGVLVFRNGEPSAATPSCSCGDQQHPGLAGAGGRGRRPAYPGQDADPLFGGGRIGFSGPFTDTEAQRQGTALVARESMIIRGSLKRLAGCAPA